jgi:hypothetical protein
LTHRSIRRAIAAKWKKLKVWGYEHFPSRFVHIWYGDRSQMPAAHQIEDEDFELLLAILREKRNEAERLVVKLEVELEKAVRVVESFDKKIARYSAPPAPVPTITSAPATRAQAPAATLPPSIIAPSGRVRRGQSEKLIMEYLTKRTDEFEGMTITGIATATGTKYPTVRRIIMEKAGEGQVELVNGFWYAVECKQVAKNLQVSDGAEKEEAA